MNSMTEKGEQGKHTPGPWMKNRGAFYGGWPIYADRQEAIAFVYGTDEANASLIAAAPDLLAACKATRDWLRTVAQRSDDLLTQMIDQALAKAEGRDV